MRKNLGDKVNEALDHLRSQGGKTARATFKHGKKTYTISHREGLTAGKQYEATKIKSQSPVTKETDRTSYTRLKEGQTTKGGNRSSHHIDTHWYGNKGKSKSAYGPTKDAMRDAYRSDY